MKLGVLTVGGDCPGLNAVIRAVVRTARAEYDSSVVGFENGWAGLIEDRERELFDDEAIDRILVRGGTILGTGRVPPAKLRDSLDRIKTVLANGGIDAIIPIGGDGTLTAALWLADNGIPVVGVPKTIDNDVSATDVTFGFDTAVSIATDAIDRLHSTAESHKRVMLVEVMGRDAGWIALEAGMAGGAHIIVIPEVPFDVEAICKHIWRRFQMGETYSILAVAEGARAQDGSMTIKEGGTDKFGHTVFTGVAQQLAVEIERRVNKEVRTTVLGYVQRGGTPTARDRVLATRFGVQAAHAAHRREFGTMVALKGNEIVSVPLRDAVSAKKLVPPERYAEASVLFG